MFDDAGEGIDFSVQHVYFLHEFVTARGFRGDRRRKFSFLKWVRRGVSWGILALGRCSLAGYKTLLAENSTATVGLKGYLTGLLALGAGSRKEGYWASFLGLASAG